MKSVALLLAAVLAALGLAAAGTAGTRTTSPGGYYTVRAVVTDQGVTLSRTRMPRGATAIFLVSNRSTASRVISLGDATLTRKRGTGFALRLGRNEQKRVLVYLTYRGPLPLSVGDAGKSKVQNIFWVT